MIIQYIEVKGELFYYSKQGEVYCNTMKECTNLKKYEIESKIKNKIEEQFNEETEFIKVKKFDKS